MAREKTDPQPAPANRYVRSGKIALLAIVLCVVALIAYRVLAPTAIKSGQYRNCNIVLITLDTTRADRLPFHGYSGLRAPHMQRLSIESHLFEDAMAQVPLTLPSHATMLTGLLPVTHGVRDNAGYVLQEKETTLAEILKTAGYATGAFVSAAVLEARWGLNQGFDTYDDRFSSPMGQPIDPGDAQRRADQTELTAERWIEANQNRNFFAWIHFYDPHDPYDPPEPYRSEYAERLYDGEIAFVDEAIGRFISKLETLKLKERTILVLTADHGEGLGEHDEPTHGMFLYNTTQHVPLLFSLPGGGSGRIPGVVTHLDLAPTILDLLGLNAPAGMQGKSLVVRMNGKDRKGGLAYSESIYPELHYGWSSLKSITTDEYRYIRAPRAELYDRKSDPQDLKNLIREKASIAKVLENELAEMETKYTSTNLSGPQQMDAETEEKLRALGYIAATARSTEESRRIDPKEKTGVARRVQEASGLLQQQSYQRALEMITPVLQSDPDIVDAHYVAGIAYFRTGKMEAAVDALLKVVNLRPEDTRALYNLAYAFDEWGRVPDAEFWYQKTLDRSPGHLLATLKLAHLYRKTNQPQKAKPYFLRAASMYEESLKSEQEGSSRYALHILLGEVYLGAGDWIAAERHFVAAVELASRVASLSADCFIRLGVLYHDTGRRDLEAATFQKLVIARPQDPRGYFYLGKAILDQRGDPGEVLSLANRGLALNPTLEMQVFGHYLLGNAYEVLGKISESQREFALAQKLEKQL